MSHLDEVTRVLTAVSLFEGLSTQFIVQIADLGTEKKFSRGEKIVVQNQLGDELFVVLTGRVEVSISGPENEHISIGTIKDGEILGESMLLGKMRRAATGVAKDSVECLVWKTNDLLRFFETEPQIGYIVMKNLARSLSDKLNTTNMALRNKV